VIAEIRYSAERLNNRVEKILHKAEQNNQFNRGGPPEVPEREQRKYSE
jgi:hypothetical protein